MDPKRMSIPRIAAIVISLFGILSFLLLARDQWHFVSATILLLVCLASFLIAFDFHTNAARPPETPLNAVGAAPDKQKEAVRAQHEAKLRRQRLLSAAGMLAALVILIILFALPPTHAYILSAYLGTPTPAASATGVPSPTATDLPGPTATPTPTATITLAPASTVSPAPTLTASPIPCFCQQSSDDASIQCLIRKESEAVNLGGQPGLDLIGKIFAPNATIFRGDTGLTWYDPLSYYSPTFADLTFSGAAHPEIKQLRLGPSQAFYTSSSKGEYTDKTGQGGNYNNPLPSEHWVLAKNAQGCWAVTYYAFNAKHITPFPPDKAP